MFYLPLNLRRCLIVGILLLCSQWLNAAQEDERFDALVIFGSGGISAWSQNFNDSFRSYLGPDLEQYFIPEFVSLVNASESEYELIAQSLALKYSNTEIDLIVPVLPEANTFTHRWRHLLAPNAAVIHVLPGNDVLHEAETFGRNDALVRSAVIDAVAQTVELMPVLLPDLERVYVIGGVGNGDQSYRERYQSAISSQETHLQFEYLSGLPPEELTARLQQAPANSAVLMTTYDRDRLGRSHRSRLVTRQLSEELAIPVFANTDTLTRFGAIGGSITSGDAYARVTSEMVLTILGDSASTVASTSPTTFMFNGGQLDRFNINRGLLPPGSQVILEQPSLWRDYGQWIVVAVLIIAAQLALIGLLLASRRQRDIAEAGLRKAHKMEALGTLAGGVAHDFNNILMAISANTELAAMQAGNNIKVQDRLSRIQSASERAENLVAQILLFSRQSASQDLQPVQICSLLEDSLESIRPTLPESCQIEFRCHSPSAIIRADTNQMHQVFMNLCVNAQHAMEGEGLIKIQASEVQIEQVKTLLGQEIPVGRYALLTFSDTGSGISQKDLYHVFEPFYSTKPLGKGTGLGLALVYEIIKSHEGYIDVKSEIGKGTTIEIYVSLESEAVKHLDNSELSELVRGNSEHILVVDDDKMVLDANSHALEGLGYKVTVFANSTAALGYFEKNAEDIDLLLTDLSMPEMDGVRLISNIRKIRKNLPTVLCTGYLDVIDSQDIGEIRLLKKPFSLHELSEALNEELNAG